MTGKKGYVATGYDPGYEPGNPWLKAAGTNAPDWMKQLLSGEEVPVGFGAPKSKPKIDGFCLLAKTLDVPDWMQGVFYQIMQERRMRGMPPSSNVHELLGQTKWWAADVPVLIACLTDRTPSAPPSICRKGERIQRLHLQFIERA